MTTQETTENSNQIEQFSSEQLAEINETILRATRNSEVLLNLMQLMTKAIQQGTFINDHHEFSIPAHLVDEMVITIGVIK